jgi:thioester reductase-like protein
MFMELLPGRHGSHSIFGVLKGWWRFTDTPLRTDSPLLDRTRWQALLTDCGFENVSSFSAYVNDAESEQAVFLAFAPAPALAEPEPKASPAATGYVVFADRSGVADLLIARLRDGGRGVVRVQPGTEFRQTGDREFTIAVDSADDMRRLLTVAAEATGGLAGVVHCWSLDHPPPAQLDTRQLSDAQRTGVLSALRLVQSESALPPQVWFVTRNVHRVEEGDPADGLASSPLVGLLRVANNELAQCRLTMVDFDAAPAAELAADLFHEVTAADDESEAAYRGGRRRALRLHRVRAEDLPVRTRNAVGPDGSLVPYRLETNKPGILTNLTLNETRRHEPGPDEIEIRVRAGGINFRDVMKALGTYPGNPIDELWFGDDVAGVVERVGANVRHLKAGDEVAGMAPYAFRAFATTDARMVFRKPPHLSFEQAATIPTVFLTAHYGLQHLARMQPGETVLIHAGAGGVGQAAIQIATRLGLEIFATAGTEDKRRLLQELGVHHVMSSRTLEFADQIQEITGGRGVDAVLNSLAGDFIPKSLSVLAPFGRFLEIGKIDIYKNSKIGLEPLRNNISYFVIDLAQHLIHKPDYVAQLFAELGERFAAGEYRPLPHSVFPVTKVTDAFRYMAQGKHIGKNVLSFDVDEIPIGPCTEDQYRFRADATYLITGGAGGFGLELARWMAHRGARHLVLSSRSGPREEASRAIEQMRAAGATVIDARCDVTCRADVTRLMRQIHDELPPLKGVIHGAMVLDDEFLSALDETRFRKALDPKMLGAWHLHVATQHLELDHFIGFSSFSSVIGAPRQSNYNAGNVFLEALAQYRHARGLPAETIAWGALLGAGFVERNQKTAQYLDKIGLKAFRLEEALRIFGRLTQLDPVQINASRTDWHALSKASATMARNKTYAALAQENRETEGGGSIVGRLLAASPDARPRLVEDFLVSQVASVFGADQSTISCDAPLTSLGLDSLMAIELTLRLERELGMGIPMASLLNGPSIVMLAQTVMRLLAPQFTAGAEAGEAGALNVGAAPLEKVETPQEEFPLSESQQAIWRLARMTPEGSVCHRVFSAKFEPSLDVALLKQAFASLFTLHPMLNVVLRQDQVPLLQGLGKNVPVDFREFDVSAGTDAQATDVLTQEAHRPFDLHHGPLVRMGVFHTSHDRSCVVLAIHQIIADSWSLSVLVDDLLQAYSAMAGGPSRTAQPPPYTFEDFVAWERKQLDGAAGSRTLEFWKRELQGAPLQSQLPTDHPRPKVATLNGAELGFTLDGQLPYQVLALSAEQGVSLFTTLLAAFDILLHHECQQHELLVGTSLSGRQHLELQPLVGCFSNVVAIRSRIDDDPTCADMLKRTGQRLAAAADNQQFPIARLIEQLQGRPDTSRPPLVQVAFLLERNAGRDQRGIAAALLGRSGHRFHWGELAIESADCPAPQTRYEITLAVEEAGGRILGCWRYNRDLFAPETIERLHAGWTAALEQIVRDPLQRVSQIEIVERPRTMHAPEWSGLVDWRGADAASGGTPIDYIQEAQLDPDIVPPEGSVCNPTRMDRVLLTGATGFLGAFLLDDLLRHTHATIYCLIRAQDDIQARQRIHTNLERYDLTPPGLSDRVVPVLGDLAQARLGLSGEEFQRLAAELDAIYHNGAIVNLIYPYPLLRDANVRGTQEILRLAAMHHVKPTHYVSTFWVQAGNGEFAREVVTEEDPLPPCEALSTGYSRSKWVCETLMEQARGRGLPVTIYRPGLVTGDSHTGACKADDFLHTIVLACTRIGSIPSLDMNLEVTPVDFVSRAIVQLSRQPEHLGNTYLLVNPHPLPLATLADWMERTGFGVRALPYDEWCDELANLAQDTPDELIGPLMNLLGRGDGVEPDPHPRYDCRRATSHLAASGIVCPPANDDLLAIYHSFLQRAGFLWHEGRGSEDGATRAATV